MKLFLIRFLVLLFFTVSLYSQSTSQLTVVSNKSGDTDEVDSPHLTVRLGGTVFHAQATVPASTPVDFGGAPILSGVDSTICNGTQADADCWSSVVDVSAGEYLLIYVEGELIGSTITFQVWLQDHNASPVWYPFDSVVITTDQAHDATNSPTQGDGLNCTTACFSNKGILTVKTFGFKNAKIFAVTPDDTSNEISIYAVSVAGSIN